MTNKLTEIHIGDIVVSKKKLRTSIIMDTMEAGLIGTVFVKLNKSDFEVIGLSSTSYINDVILTRTNFPSQEVGKKIEEFYLNKFGGQITENIKNGIKEAITTPPRKVRIDLDQM